MAWFDAGLGSSGGGGSSSNNYSTSEQVVGTLTDGGTLYEKTVHININSSGVYRLWIESSVDIHAVSILSPDGSVLKNDVYYHNQTPIKE